MDPEVTEATASEPQPSEPVSQTPTPETTQPIQHVPEQTVTPVEPASEVKKPSVLDTIRNHIFKPEGTEDDKTASQTDPEKKEEQTVQPEKTVEDENGRYQQRIDALAAERAEAQQQLQMMQAFIASNPAAREEYQKALNQGTTEDQPQPQLASDPQGLPSGGWYGEVNSDPSSLDAIDPYAENFEEVLREHGKVLINDMVKDRLAPVMQMLDQVVPHVEQMVQTQHQTAQEQAGEKLDTLMREGLPSVKDNNAHYVVSRSFLKEVLDSPDYRQGKITMEDAAQMAIRWTKDSLGIVGQPQPVPQPQPAPVGQPQPQVQPQQQMLQPRTYSESPTNLVAPRTAPRTIAESISGHLQASGH